jgi:hypothetical protein
VQRSLFSRRNLAAEAESFVAVGDLIPEAKGVGNIFVDGRESRKQSFAIAQTKTDSSLRSE